MKSPDGRISISFNNDKSGMTYSVKVGRDRLINKSALGLSIKAGERAINERFSLKSAQRLSVDSVWTQPWGENKRIRENYNELSLLLVNSDCSLNLRFKVFDDGFAFRYEYEVANADSLLVLDEYSCFNFSLDGPSWSIPSSAESYEFEYRNMPLSGVQAANTPITARLGKHWISVHEASITDFPEMTLKKQSNNCFKAELAPWPDGVKARFTGNRFCTPWRSVQIGSNAVDLINSSLILNLNEPCKLETTDWIKPMKYVGIWWGMHLGIESWVINDRHGATTENTLKYIDFAADNNIDAVLIEGWNEGWESWGGRQNFDFTKPYADFDIARICDYARDKGVKIIGHHETGGNVPNYDKQLDKAYSWYAALGVHDVKTGYAGGLPSGHSHHGQFNVRHYRRVVETAAKYHTTINAHEPIKASGIRRTYPNMMTREGARGMEWNAWSDGNDAVHTLTLPFTRLLSGPMDYTPGIFDIMYQSAHNSPDTQKWNMKDSRECRIKTTLARQIAHWVILYSPMQMACDLIENYEGHPAFQFFRDYDADCDWSRALCGEPGQYIAVVRRSGDRFYLGAATDYHARELDIDLDWLEEGVEYKAVIYADAQDAHWESNPLAYTISEKRVRRGDSLKVLMASGGGQAVYFEPMI